MPPKGKKGGKKKAAAKASTAPLNPEDLDFSVSELVLRSQMRLDALEMIYTQHVEEFRVCCMEEAQLRHRHHTLESDRHALQKERFDVVSDFTRQYKSVQDALVCHLTQLENAMTDLRDQLDLSKLAISETRKEKEQCMALKDREIEEQEEKMKEMSREFDQMLSETLDRMSERMDGTVADPTAHAQSVSAFSPTSKPNSAESNNSKRRSSPTLDASGTDPRSPGSSAGGLLRSTASMRAALEQCVVSPSDAVAPVP